MSPLSRLLRYYRTIRYLRPGQIANRLLRKLRRFAGLLTGALPSGPADEVNAVFVSLYQGLRDFPSTGPWDDEVRRSLERAKGAAERRFTFLNRCERLDAGWDGPEVSRLWRYHLHYFDFARDLFVWAAAGHPDPAYEAFRSLANSWIESNRTVRGDGWHPYTISLRLVNWLEALAVFSEPLSRDEIFRRQLVDSIRAQAGILHRDLELDVRGNHLLANLRTLTCFCLSFSGGEAQKWLDEALKLLEEEIAVQVLPDGGHFERCPGYHLTVLQHCIEILILLKSNRRVPPPWLESAVRRMLNFLVAIQTPDSGVPLVKDTVREAGPLPDDLLAAGVIYFKDPAYKRGSNFGLYPLLLFGSEGWQQYRNQEPNRSPRDSMVLESSGFLVWRDEAVGDHFILDAGEPCPPCLPAHAHADLLSYELTMDGHRVIVDSGVYEYEAGPWRDYFRSTRAHNTVVIEDCDQSEVWDSFRVGHRAHPGRLYRVTSASAEIAQADHDGYRRLACRALHRRTVAWRRDRLWVVLDEITGRGSTHASSCVHFSPLLSLESCGQSAWRIDGYERPIWLSAFGQSDQKVVCGQMNPQRQGWYSEQFGLIQPNPALILESGKPLPICFGYVISKRSPAELQIIALPAANRVVIRHDGEELRFTVSRDAPPRFECE